MITHATDSTTKKGVGQFAVACIHIDQNVPFPLPLIPVSGESTKDITDQCSLMFQILAAVSDKSGKEIYEQVDAHMTDSTEHNKGFAEIMKDMNNLDTAAGQLFCGTHTTLGFPSAMNKQLALVERDMTLEVIFQNFMVDLDFDSKHGSVAGQALGCILWLVAPEFQQNPGITTNSLQCILILMVLRMSCLPIRITDLDACQEQLPSWCTYCHQ